MSPAKLVAWRRRMRWSQAEAARALGPSLRTYRRWEVLGMRYPRLLTLACAQLELQQNGGHRRS